MNRFQQITLLGMRLALGVIFFYAGITKLFNSSWSAAGYLKGAKTFSWLFQWMLDPAVLSVVNFLNEWGLTLLGVSLLIGALVRYSSYAGIALMSLYYLAAIDFPYPNTHAFLVDEHIVYSIALLALIVFDAGRLWGVDGWLANRQKVTK